MFKDFKEKVSVLFDLTFNYEFDDLTVEDLNDISELINSLSCFDGNSEILNLVSNVVAYECVCLNGCDDTESCDYCYDSLVGFVYELYSALDCIVVCSNCGFLEFEENCVEVNGCYYCADCEAPVTLTEYHGYTVCDNTFSDFTIGLELETEFPLNVDTDLVCASVDTDFIPSYDGSLNNGIEFVSNVYDVCDKEVLYDEIVSIVNQLKDFNCKCHKSINSGLHIHVNKKAFDVPIKNLFDFVYNNKVFFMSISGRMPCFEAFNYCKPVNNYVDSEHVSSRYGLLNMNEKYDTVEFRLFNSSLNYGTIIKRIEFVLVLVEFLNSGKPLCLVDFLNFVENKDVELFDWMSFWFGKRVSDIWDVLSENSFKY